MSGVDPNIGGPAGSNAYFNISDFDEDDTSPVNNINQVTDNKQETVLIDSSNIEKVSESVDDLASNNFENSSNEILDESQLKEKIDILKEKQKAAESSQISDTVSQNKDFEVKKTNQKVHDNAVLIFSSNKNEMVDNLNKESQKVQENIGIKEERGQIKENRKEIKEDRKEIKEDRKEIKEDQKEKTVEAKKVETAKVFSVEEKQKREDNIKKFIILEPMPNGQFREINADPANAEHMEKIGRKEAAQKRDGKLVFLPGLAKSIENAPEKISIIHPDGSVTEHLKSEIFVAATKEDEEAAEQAVSAYREILDLEKQQPTNQTVQTQQKSSETPQEETTHLTQTPTHSDEIVQNASKRRDASRASQKEALDKQVAREKLAQNNKSLRELQQHVHEIKQIRLTGKRKRDEANRAQQEVINAKELNRENVKIENEMSDVTRENVLSQFIKQQNEDQAKLFDQVVGILLPLQNWELTGEKEDELHRIVELQGGAEAIKKQLNDLVVVIELYPKPPDGKQDLRFEEFKVLVNHLRIVIGKI